MLKKASEVIAEGDLGKVVDFTIDLNRRKAQVDKDMEELKSFLRDAARKQSTGSFEIELEGLSGTVTVTFPGLTVKEKKGADLKDLEVNLPPEVFAALFKRTIEIVPAVAADDFLEALAQQTPAHQATVRNFVEIVPQTPKVFVPR